MKRLEQTWRWFGPRDPITLADIKQTGATGIVTALHHIPNGEVWTIEEIQKRQDIISEAGLVWSVVESIPITEDMKKQKGACNEHTINWCKSLEHLGSCGIQTVTYNFMPVLDWTRTDLNYVLPSGALASRFDMTQIAAFDLFILQRPNAEIDYTESDIAAAQQFMESATSTQMETLVNNILAGLPGSEETYSLSQFKEAISDYHDIDRQALQNNLMAFLDNVVPVAKKHGIKLALHPDDPPISLFGLPRIVSTAEDLRFILSHIDHPSNGLCFCTGSLGVRKENQLADMVREFADRINFVHLRSTSREESGSFFEDNHLDGDVDMFSVMHNLVIEQQNREKSIPMRPDHGHRMLDDIGKKTTPGYPAIGRLRGLAELRGLEQGILGMMNLLN